MLFQLRERVALAGVVICLLATGPLAAPASARQDPPSLPDLVEEASASIATILVYEQGALLPTAQGTGWLMDGSTLVTCHHVMDGAHRAEVRFPGGEVLQVTGVRAHDETHDLAILDLPKGKRSRKGLTLAPRTPRIGEDVVVIGSPQSLDLTVTEGIISSVRRLPAIGQVIQMTAAISPGSSGSPVMDSYGRVLGTASFRLSAGQSLNFAIPNAVLEDMALDPPVALQAWNEASVVSEEGMNEEFLELMRTVLEGNLKAALEGAESFLESEEDKHQAYALLGYVYEQLGQLDKAIHNYKMAINVDPKDTDTHMLLGYASCHAGEFESSIASFKWAIKLTPDKSELHAGLGYVYDECDRFAEAIKAYRRALALDSRAFNAVLNLGVTYGKMGRHAEEAAQYRKALLLNAEEPLPHFNLGIWHLKYGQKGDALIEHKIIKGLDPERAAELFGVIEESTAARIRGAGPS